MQKLSRILIVDDNPSNIFVLEEMLRDSYWEHSAILTLPVTAANAA